LLVAPLEVVKGKIKGKEENTYFYLLTPGFAGILLVVGKSWKQEVVAQVAIALVCHASMRAPEYAGKAIGDQT